MIASRLGEVRRRAGLPGPDPLAAQGFADRVKPHLVGTVLDGKISDVSVLNYENEKVPRKIPGDYLAAVCREFEVSPWWLLMGVGQPDDPPPDTDAYLRGMAYAADRMESALGDVRAKLAPLSAFRRVSAPTDNGGAGNSS